VFGSFCRFPLCLEGYLRVLSEIAGCGINATHSSHPSLFLEFLMLANNFRIYRGRGMSSHQMLDLWILTNFSLLREWVEEAAVGALLCKESRVC
jgi:hypothetical protein